jgi:hypothetical protein
MQKKWNVKSAMHDDAWIRKITPYENFSMAHASQLLDLWT